MIISISNQKGGVGKTTTATNLAGGLALQGYKTLLIDVDPQANATIGLLGMLPKNHIAQIFMQETTAKKIMIKRSQNFYVLPSSIELAKTIQQISNVIAREYILKKALQEVAYMDYIIIDTPPDLSLLSQNAWTASDGVIIPVQTEYYALHGLDQLISTIYEIKESTNTGINIMGILPTMYDDRKNQHKEALEIIRGIQLHSFQSIIRTNSKLPEAPAESKTIQEYDSSSKGAKDYTHLIDEILKGLNK